jgi:hypothetical protein
MKRITVRVTQLVCAIAIGALFLSADDKMPSKNGWMTKADARIGRPLTPFSYAGVARRTTRRAVAVGAATRPMVVAPGAVVIAPARRCVQAVDAYGRIITRCY